MSSLPNGKLPFTRYHVKHRPAGDSLAEGMENIPLSVWNDFWSKIELASEEIDRTRFHQPVVFILLMCVFIPLSFYFTILSSFYFYGVFVIALLQRLVDEFFWYSNVKSQHERLQDVCRNEYSTFKSFGFAIECTEERRKDGHPDGLFYIYFYPIKDTCESCSPEITYRNGYLRVEIAKALWCSRKMTTTSLPYYDYLPNGLESTSLSLTEWTAFWAKADAACNKFVAHRRGSYWSALLYLVAFPFVYDMNDVIIQVVAYVLFPLAIFFSYFLGHLYSIDEEMKRIHQEYAEVFESHGIYMEYRGEVDWTTASSWNRVSGNLHHYIYLFPIAEAA